MATKKPTKKAATKHKTTRKTSKKSTVPSFKNMKSFKLSHDVVPFTTFRFTAQTVYWLLLSLVILILALWILNLQLQVVQLTNNINTPFPY